MTIRTFGRKRPKAVWGFVVVVRTLIAAPLVCAQTVVLEPARALYAAAAYDDALVALDTLRAAARPEDVGRIEYYRALCLLALGRSTDAEAAIETAITADPLAQPSEADMSPRVRAAFREVRQRMLPAIIRQKYEDARSAFMQKDLSAPDKFREVVALLDEPDAQMLPDQETLAQLRELAAGYLALTVQRQP